MNLSSSAKSEIGRSDYCMYRHPRQSSLENIVHHLAQETKKLYMYVRYFFRQSSKFVEDSVKVFHRTLFVKTIDYSPKLVLWKKKHPYNLLRMFKLVKERCKKYTTECMYYTHTTTLADCQKRLAAPLYLHAFRQFQRECLRE